MQAVFWNLLFYIFFKNSYFKFNTQISYFNLPNCHISVKKISKISLNVTSL